MTSFRPGDRVCVHPSPEDQLPEWMGVTGTVFKHDSYPDYICVRFDKKLPFWYQDWAVWGEEFLRRLDETPFSKNLREYIQAELNTE